MAIYLSLGSNLGDRRDNLRRALAGLAAEAIRVERVSPVVESPALLPPGASPDWNAPFLNLVAACRATLSPDELLAAVKRIERRLGRADRRHWAPRPIDIDILLYDDARIETTALTIPHPGLTERSFVLTPLAHLSPGLRIPGYDVPVLRLHARAGRRIPLWMGIVNLTPDSFSDGGSNESWPDIETHIDAMIAGGAHYLDFGAESTRPGATPLRPDEEWSRLEPILGRVMDKLGGDPLRPRISVDTYHTEVAARSLNLGVDAINDVGGLTQPGMIALAAAHEAEFVAMHNLGLPADPARTLPTDTAVIGQIESWLDDRLRHWQAEGLDLTRIVFDPGVGFGKNALQSLEVLRGIERFGDGSLRLLVGHSRKSFMQTFTESTRAARDLITIGGSLALCRRGVDILRVHNVPDHVTAWRGWAHFRPPG